MSLRDCDVCGTSITACNTAIRETGRECCALCLTKDTHGLLSTTKLDRLEHEMAVFSRHIARTLIWHTEVGKEFAKLIMRCEGLERDVSGLQAENEQLRLLLSRSSAAELREDIDDVDDNVEELENRVDTLERCLAEIENRLKIRRKPVGERITPSEVLGPRALPGPGALPPAPTPSPTAHSGGT